MERKYLDDLDEWLNDPLRKPLIVWGARQVGKTYLIRDIFAERRFKGKYLYIDCHRQKNFVSFCQSHVDPRDIIDYLSLQFGVDISDKTLLIFDEAQDCLPLISSLKYFCEEYREIPVILTGSMVRMKMERENRGRGKKKGFLFPVGKINQLTIHPLDYEEFLLNCNKKLHQALAESYASRKALDPGIAELALSSLYDYLLVGGMPEPLDAFLSSKSHKKALDVLKDVYDNYLSDMQLYQMSRESFLRTNAVFSNIYSELSQENKNFKCSNIEEGSRNRDFYFPIQWLNFAYLVNRSSLVKEKVTFPLISREEGSYRLYLNDMGMFSYQSQIDAFTFLEEDGRNSLKGIYFENFVSCELVHNGFPLFYWKGKGDSEMEFLLAHGGYVYPIDVKAKRGSLSSLKKYREHNSPDMAIKVSRAPLSYDEERKVLNVPFYQFFLLLKEMKENEGPFRWFPQP